MSAGVLMAGLNFGTAIQQSGAIDSQEILESAMFDINRMWANVKKEDALRRGKEAASKHRKKVGRIIGSQRAALAAQGIDIGSGSARDVQESTMVIGEEEAEMIRVNSIKEAFGYEVQALNLELEKRFNTQGRKQQSRNTLIGGAVNAAGSYYNYSGVNLDGSKKKPSGKGEPSNDPNFRKPANSPDGFFSQSGFEPRSKKKNSWL